MEFPSTVVYRLHAVRRMFERSISENEVEKILQVGKVICEYHEDTPYPSFLILGWSGERPIHVVAAKDTDEGISIVITVYEPSLEEWKSGFVERRQP